ncbi:GH1 family beta-glucosidase [Roseitalea porphyridii]|uniref:Beta-glucosidase n=1 Tax=Roseitalea porphyridii TaxID=1852022 RepID=A0A4P6V1U3_9HYPH|nr:GH1 family beta-glucosidase [Roseitalea porphyridii]QBK30629.1 beta-glucosidase [Roseitalea porphyridii]
MANGFSFRRSDFADDFLFGVATSAYQIEGASFGGAGPSHWDTFAATPGNTKNAEDGAVACDHYHRYETDLDLIAGANLDTYRFSTSWARVMPDGRTVNPEGLDFYDRLTDAMLERGIKPMLTLHHWDMPAALADEGGWRNRAITDHFATFAGHVIDRIGDRMFASGTFNEPWCIGWLSHFLGQHAPGLRDIRATARAMHHVLVAHGKAVDVLRAAGQDNVGIYLNFEPAEPANGDDGDAEAALTYHAIYNEWFLGALFKKRYPRRALAGLEPHLPEGWRDDMELIARPIDWLGINNYTRKLVARAADAPWPSLEEVPGPLPKTDMGWEISPESFAWLLSWIAESHTGDLPLIVSENGMANPDTLADGRVDDAARIAYLQAHIDAMKGVIEEGVPIKGYTVWSLLDNYEWALGYGKRFGIVHVDYDTLERTPKASWHALRDALARR